MICGACGTNLSTLGRKRALAHQIGDAQEEDEDEDDLYDWFTFPQALFVLPPPERAALADASVALQRAAAAGIVPPLPWQRGGVFGAGVVTPPLLATPGGGGGAEGSIPLPSR